MKSWGCLGGMREVCQVESFRRFRFHVIVLSSSMFVVRSVLSSAMRRQVPFFWEVCQVPCLLYCSLGVCVACQVATCTSPEPFDFAWAPLQTARARRDGTFGAASTKHVSAAQDLIFYQWRGLAESVGLSTEKRASWSWNGEGMPKDSSCGHADMLPGSSDDEVDEPVGAKFPSDFLRMWGVSESAQHIPVLLVPEPIAYLISQGVWTELVLRTGWHSTLVNEAGDSFKGRALPGIGFPSQSSALWDIGPGDHPQDSVLPKNAPMNPEDT